MSTHRDGCALAGVDRGAHRASPSPANRRRDRRDNTLCKPTQPTSQAGHWRPAASLAPPDGGACRRCRVLVIRPQSGSIRQQRGADAAPPEVATRTALIAAEGGAGRRSAKNADRPMHQSREAHRSAWPLHSPVGGPSRPRFVRPTGPTKGMTSRNSPFQTARGTRVACVGVSPPATADRSGNSQATELASGAAGAQGCHGSPEPGRGFVSCAATSSTTARRLSIAATARMSISGVVSR
jgi:hypothetical protein